MKRRKLRGKKLLACGAVLGAAAVLESCWCAVANLVAPDAGADAGFDAGPPGMDAGSDAGMDAGTDAGVDGGMDAGADAAMGDEDAGPGPTDAVIIFPDGPVANLIAPPDGNF